MSFLGLLQLLLQNGQGHILLVLLNHQERGYGFFHRYHLEDLARCLLPDIQVFYESEEGQREFAEEQEKANKTAT